VREVAAKTCAWGGREGEREGRREGGTYIGGIDSLTGGLEEAVDFAHGLADGSHRGVKGVGLEGRREGGGFGSMPAPAVPV